MDDDLRALRDSCTHALAGHGLQSPADLLATIPPDTVADRYGDGGVVTDLEAEVADVLGQQAAVYLPSGTMAQQAALRVHAGRTGRRTVLFHPECHLDQHEGRAMERLHGLVGRPVGDRSRLLTLADLTAVAEPAAALLLELPQRDLGGQLPAWDDLVAQTGWARERGSAVHLDGARLWEASAGYGRPPAEIAALFDTTYVSFYKGLGALAGCCLAGPADVVAEVREWRGRMGGTLFGLWPGAASALSCLRRRLPLMPGYLAHARAIADAVRDLPGVTVVADPPQTPMLHLLLRTTPEAFAAAARTLATDRGLWAWEKSTTTGDPAVQRVELPIGDATMALTPEQVRDAVGVLSGRAQSADHLAPLGRQPAAVMSTQIAIRLDDDERAALDAEVAAGRAVSRSEAVRRGIACLQRDQRYRGEEATLIELARRGERTYPDLDAVLDLPRPPMD